MRTVQFLRHHVALSCASYNAGELAAFPEAEAAELVERGIAKYVETAKVKNGSRR